MNGDPPHSVLPDTEAPAIELENEAASASARPRGWLPVLTDVVELGDQAPADATLVAVPDPEPEPEAIAEPGFAATAAETTTVSDVPASPSPTGAALAEELMAELAPRVARLVDEQVSAALRKSLDDTLGALLPQLDATLREVVRDAIAEKLASPDPQ